MTAASTPRDPRVEIMARAMDDLDREPAEQCILDCTRALSALSEAGWEVARLEEVRMGFCTKCGWYGSLLDSERRLHPDCNYAAIDTQTLYRKLEPQEESP